MQITFDPLNPADVAHVKDYLAFRAAAEQPAQAAPPAAPAPVPAPAPCAPVAPAPVAVAAPPAAPPVQAAPPVPPTVPPPSSEHEAARQRLTEIVAQLGPAGQQVGALLTQVGAQSVSGLTLEQLRWVLAEAEKMVPAA